MSAPRINPRHRSAGLRPGTLLLLLTIFVASCHTAPPLPPADFSVPGWRVQQGQAIWKPTRARPELAGELLFATQTNGNFFIQFSKPPFNLAAAQMLNGQWQIEFGNGERRWSGHGEPPARFAWFQFLRAFAGESLKSNWRFTRAATDSWQLENLRTGESLEGGFFP